MLKIGNKSAIHDEKTSVNARPESTQWEYPVYPCLSWIDAQCADWQSSKQVCLFEKLNAYSKNVCEIERNGVSSPIKLWIVRAWKTLLNRFLDFWLKNFQSKENNTNRCVSLGF